MTKLFLLFAVAVFFSFGCSKQQDEQAVPQPGGDTPTEQTEKPAEPRDAVQEAIEDVTGVSAVRKGEEVKDRLRNIQEDRRKQLDEYGDF